MRSVLGELLDEDGAAGDVVVDMEAGLEHLSRGTTRHVDAVLAVAEPYYRSLETARRVAELAAEFGIGRVQLVANKVRDPADADAIRGFADRHELTVLAEIPYDDAVAEADRLGRPLLDTARPDSAAVRSIRALSRALLAHDGTAAWHGMAAEAAEPLEAE